MGRGSGRKRERVLAGHRGFFGGARSFTSGAVCALDPGKSRWEAHRMRPNGLAAYCALDWRCSNII